jgi:hypothetical protein
MVYAAAGWLDFVAVEYAQVEQEAQRGSAVAAIRVYAGAPVDGVAAGSVVQSDLAFQGIGIGYAGSGPDIAGDAESGAETACWEAVARERAAAVVRQKTCSQAGSAS